ncbi:MAG: PilZ domain-containing protein [Nitrospiraceae bacterium]|nr:MAG: PilZ domain-containing protein [Nitrospiraceae bacterium]
MALVKKQKDSMKRHPQPRAIKEEPPIEKRQQPRFTSQFRSTISGGHGEGQGRTLDLSAGGCMIETDLPVVVGALFECRIYVPGLDWPLRIDEAQVRWVKANTFGIQFMKIHPDEQAKLKRVIAALDEEPRA